MSNLAALQPLDQYNQSLQQNVHPVDWQNPTPRERYNLVVVGGGTAGLVSAAIATGLGAKVALVERALLGGDCLNVGCVPSKALISAARKVAEIRDACDYGVFVNGTFHVDFPLVMERMRRLRAGISPHDSATRFTSLGVDVYIGQGKFTGKDQLEVDGKVLRFKKAVITTGARAAASSIAGLEEVGYLTNETLFSLTELPRRLAIIGGGPIGSEMAQAFARFGSQVTLIDQSSHILSREEEDAALIVQRSLERDGVELKLRSEVVRVTEEHGEKRMDVQQDGEADVIVADEILLGIGRAPNVEGLGLDVAGVEYDSKQGVRVNNRLQTTNQRIYAAGDVCSKYKFTHAADFMARLVVRNALFLGNGNVEKLVIPWATYTSPELAHVGMYPQDAKRLGIETSVFEQRFDTLDRAILDGETDGFVRVLVRKGTDEILGATAVASHAGDMIGELSLAMTNGLGLSKIGNAIHPYPTQFEAVRRLRDLYSRTRLNPTIKGLFDRWLKFTR